MTNSSSNARPPLRLRVFLASPGDVQDERALALRVLERLPYDPFLRGRLVLETVAWDKPGADTPMLATLTPQEAISQQRPKPSECDVVVVIFWSRMGTPLPEKYVKDDGVTPYLSGTEWEYLDAVRASEAKGRPTVLVYRRTEVPSFKADDSNLKESLAQWELVQTFFASFQNQDGSIRGGVNEYDTPDTFEQRLAEHLREIVRQRLEEHDARTSAPGGAVETTLAATSEESPPLELWQGSPFPGLRAFGEDDAPIYFGRSRETDALLRHLSRGDRFVAVVGASGSGKSSLVAAGLIPRLRANAVPGSRDWHITRFTPGDLGDDPFVSLLTAFRPTLDAHQRKVRAEAERLAAEPDTLKDLVTLALDGRPDWSELVLFADQFEELFTVVADRHREPFCRLLAEATLQPKVRVVLTLRADFYHRCVEQPTLAELLRAGSFPLAAPDSVALEEMISRPPERAGLVFDEGLSQQILRDTGNEPGALPLLAFALSELYESGQEGGRLTAAAYASFGGVQGAISQRAETTFETLDAKSKAELDTVFRELVEVREAEGGWVATRRRSPLRRVAPNGAAEKFVTTFVAARLLVQSEGEDAQPWVDVSHEALLRNWPRMVEWVEAKGADLALLREFRRATELWERSGHQGEYLWARRRWRQAGAVVERLRPQLSEFETQFLKVSRKRSRTRMVAAGAAVIVLGALGGWLHYENVAITEAFAMLKARLGWDYGEPELVRISAGTFAMGEQNASHEVAVGEPFSMGKYEVTFDQYDLYARLTKRPLPSQSGFGRGRRPVINVSWEDATAYAAWLSEKTGKDYGLPTEAEWEYAARAGTKTAYSWGDDIGENNANCRGCGSPWDGDQTAPVGSFEANPWGLHDMHGNVWEWVQDCYGDYADAPRGGSAAPETEGCPRVLRGGSWDQGPVYLRASYRLRNNPDFRYYYIGFRVVCRPQPSAEC